MSSFCPSPGSKNVVKNLLQAFRTKVFLTTSDPDMARFASELCSKARPYEHRLHLFGIQF